LQYIQLDTCSKLESISHPVTIMICQRAKMAYIKRHAMIKNKSIVSIKPLRFRMANLVRQSLIWPKVFFTGWCGAQRNISQVQKNVGHLYDSCKRSKFRPLFFIPPNNMKIHSILNTSYICL
jgi:hypothetical protein